MIQPFSESIFQAVRDVLGRFRAFSDNFKSVTFTTPTEIVLRQLLAGKILRYNQHKKDTIGLILSAKENNNDNQNTVTSVVLGLRKQSHIIAIIILLCIVVNIGRYLLPNYICITIKITPNLQLYQKKRYSL